MFRKTISPFYYSTFLFIVFVAYVECVSLEQDLTLTLKEKHALDKFRERVKSLLYQDYMKTEIYLLRFLRARSFNVNDAEKMLKENLRWRRENKIDTIGEEDFDDMWRDFPAHVDTYDKLGRPIGEIHSSDWDIRNAVLTGRAPRFMRFLYMLSNNMTMQVYERQRRGMNVTQFVVLGNTGGFSMIKHGCPVCLPVWIQFLNSYENYFPGMMHEMIMVDASRAVHTMFDMMRPFLTPQTRDALRVLSQNKNEWMAYLDERISRDQRRPFYGGTKPPLY